LLNSESLWSSGDERSFHLVQKTWASGIDFRAKGYPLYSGIEYYMDRGDTYASDTTAPFNRLTSKTDSHSVQAYFETLITRALSLGVSAAYSDVQVMEPNISYSGHRKKAQATLSYFLPHDLSLSVQGIVESSHLQFNSRKDTIIPEINWYLLDNALRLNVKGKMESNSTSGISDRVDEIAFNFFWYY